jgi:glycosyltransferase involved in cell wall biosynthesis
MTTIHVLGNPSVPTGTKHRTEAFSFHTYKYIKYLHKEFHMIHYGIPGAEVDCEHIDVSSMVEAGKHIKQNSKKDDIIACFFGHENSPACKMNPHCKWIEPSIGYRVEAVFAPYRAFTSYALMNRFYGYNNVNEFPSWFDIVIPNPFTISEFEFSAEKDDYCLCFGRVVREKGIDLAIQITEHLNQKLIIAGPGTLQEMGYTDIPDHVEVIGTVGPDERKELLKKAKCVFGLTYYSEPFGNMIIEANLSGTPVITTDWGSFPEIVKEGYNGYRIRTFAELKHALLNIQNIRPIDCYRWGLRFSDENVHQQHAEYLRRITIGDFYHQQV